MITQQLNQIEQDVRVLLQGFKGSEFFKITPFEDGGSGIEIDFEQHSLPDDMLSELLKVCEKHQEFGTRLTIHPKTPECGMIAEIECSHKGLDTLEDILTESQVREIFAAPASLGTSKRQALAQILSGKYYDTIPLLDLANAAALEAAFNANPEHS